MKYYCVSDLHLGDKGPKDDFLLESEMNLELFLQSIPDKSLILVGDILDLWQCSVDKIHYAYYPLLKTLSTKVNYYIVGNHDSELTYFLGIPTVKSLAIGDTLFMHGHQFDLANSKYKWLGKSITKLAGWLEKYIHKDIDKWAEQLVMKLKKLGRFGFPDYYKNEAIQHAKQNGMKQIVIGHSHVEDYAKVDGIEYHNCGTWTNGKSHIVEVNIL